MITFNPLTPRSDKNVKSPYNIQQTGKENIKTYQVEVFILIQHQILTVYLQGNVLEIGWRVKKQILGV